MKLSFWSFQFNKLGLYNAAPRREMDDFGPLEGSAHSHTAMFSYLKRFSISSWDLDLIINFTKFHVFFFLFHMRPETERLASKASCFRSLPTVHPPFCLCWFSRPQVCPDLSPPLFISCSGEKGIPFIFLASNQHRKWTKWMFSTSKVKSRAERKEIT